MNHDRLPLMQGLGSFSKSTENVKANVSCWDVCESLRDFKSSQHELRQAAVWRSH